MSTRESNILVLGSNLCIKEFSGTYWPKITFDGNLFYSPSYSLILLSEIDLIISYACSTLIMDVCPWKSLFITLVI